MARQSSAEAISICMWPDVRVEHRVYAAGSPFQVFHRPMDLCRNASSRNTAQMKKLRQRMERFVWQPGVGRDPDALARLRTQFRRPPEPMGEAWFMGERRRMFHELGGDLGQISAGDLQKPLQEIASGTSSFGPMAE